MALLNRKELSSLSRRTIEVDLPEVGGSVRLREMNGLERDQFEVTAFREKGDGKTRIDPMFLRARLVARCLVDENDNRLYGDDEIEQLNVDLPASVLAKIFDAAQKLNGVEPGAIDAAKKDSSGGLPSDSVTGLH
jgi:hypothetical protein